MNGKDGAQRRDNGNVIILCCVTFAVVALALLIAYSFCGLYLVHNRLQGSVNEIALAGAKKLNEKDRLGQMNNMIVRCRQLVYTSRAELEKTKKDLKDLESFAEPLLKESREAAAKLEGERKNLRDRARIESVETMQAQFDAIRPSYAVTLPWLRISEPRMSSPSFGKLVGLRSNVEELGPFTDLSKDDRARNYVDSPPSGSGGSMSKRLNLYAAEDNLRLSAPDDDLIFKLSTLPPPVNGVISPARILLPRSFTESAATSPDYAPCAAQVRLSIRVQTGIGPYAASIMESTGTCVTTGASGQL